MEENLPAKSGPKVFPEDVRVFACILIDEKVLDFDAFDRLVELAPSGCSLLDFGQLIIDQDICEDFERVQEALDAACEAIEAGKKAPWDPFDTGDDFEEPMSETADEAEASPVPGSNFSKGSGGDDAEDVPAESDESAPEQKPEPDAYNRQKIPMPKKSAKVDDEEPSSSGPKKIKFSGTITPFAKGDSPSGKGGDYSLADLADQALRSLSDDAPKKPTLGSVKPSAKVPSESRGPAKRVSLNEDTLESLAAAASAAVDKVAKMPDAAPANAMSKAEKPGESWIAAQGVSADKPDFRQLSGASGEELKTYMISLLLHCANSGYSDLHISSDARPFARKHGAVDYLDEKVLTAEEAKGLNTSLLSEEQLKYFDDQQDYDFAVPFDTGHRFRTNLMVHKDGIAGTYRIVPGSPAPIEKLGYSDQRTEVLKKLLTYHNGLVLVTGPVGSGKTMTLASLVAEMNQNRTDHVICVEEPIEIVHQSDQCSVTQRGVGPHTNTFHSALKGALRQDPDIIVIGEMRDLETIEMAISASETGHLVIGTMHTSDASNTLNRLLDVFPPAQQPQIRAMVAESLKGIVCQRLLPGKSGGVVLACELLLNNTAVAALIREGKSQGLSNIMETGKRDGMILMDNSVLELFQAGEITEETARANIKNEVLLRNLNPGAMSSSEPQPAKEEPKKRGFFRK
ncbi:MAG: PilT/PilU family type 4a pilus ATPase [Opitutales bacterium]